MTACVFITGSNGIEVFSDGAAYDDDGVLGHYSLKVDLLPHIPAIVFARGGGSVTDYAKRYLSILPTFDDMVTQMASAIKRASIMGKIVANDPLNIGVIIGGFSESAQEWQAWRMGARADGGEIVPESFKADRLPSFYAEPWPDAASIEAVGLGTEDDFRWNHTVSDGIALMEAIRRSEQQLHPDSDMMGCLCGGFVQRSVVTMEMTATEIVHRWPDKIGEKMNPGRYMMAGLVST